MVRTIMCIFLFVMASFLVNCSGNRLINLDKPELGESVQIQMKDGRELQGVLIAKEDSVLKYVDAGNHTLGILPLEKINLVQRSLQIYDLEGNVIPEKQIGETKGIGKTVGYSIAGTVLGAAVGFGVGVIIASQSDVPIGYSMAAFGLAGGITLGIVGNQHDREDAIEKIRKERLSSAQEELREQLLQEQKLLDEEKKQKEKMIKDIDQQKR